MVFEWPRRPDRDVRTTGGSAERGRSSPLVDDRPRLHVVCDRRARATARTENPRIAVTHTPSNAGRFHHAAPGRTIFQLMVEGSIPADLHAAVQAVNEGDLLRGRRICDEVIERNRKDVSAIDLRGQIFLAQGYYAAAAADLERCVRLRPKDHRPLLKLGEIRMFQGRYPEATALFDKVLRLKPQFEKAIAYKASVCQRTGKHDRAAHLLEPYISAGTESAEMAIVHSALKLRDRDFDEVKSIARRHADSKEIDPMARSLLFSYLGRACEETGEIDAAFEAYTESNAVAAVPFSEETWEQGAQAVMDLFTREVLQSLPRATRASDAPVFIVGMPRSGSTLIESVLDAHPAVRSGGEMIHLPRIAATFALDAAGEATGEHRLSELTQETVNRLNRKYLDAAKLLGGKAVRIIDKNLLNYRFLWLIQLLFPDSRVIYCRRDPLDTCLSCFASPLPMAAHPYKSTLRRLGVAHRTCERLMAHWREAVDVPIFDARYEDMVANQEQTTRRLLEFCGLEWDDACLHFYESKRIILTASYDQANRPVYRSSIGRAKPFEAHLGPLKQALGEAMPASSSDQAHEA